jgi:hypothetical protein
LDFVFGERSVTDLTDFRNLERELSIIAEMKQCLRQEAEISSAMSGREAEMTEIRGDIERIESKYGIGAASQLNKMRRASEMMSDGDDEISLSQRSKKRRTHK